MSSPARTILVTGFEPFGGEPVNASWEAAQKLEGWRHGGAVATARVLPCAYDASVKQLISAIETLRPDALLMTGQAARRGVVCVERFAHNLDDASAPDNDGVRRRALRISRSAPDWLEAAAPIRTIARAINEAGISARVSKNAGAFVCNHLYFAALQYLRERKSAIPAVFVHLPVTPEQTPQGASERRLTPTAAADALRAAAAALIDRTDEGEAA
ncbi:MAG TPA: pyroglutamyl-peptidase I [Roseiarcus sp.]|nr:pyroglutamyl-peptidase I [Roseiarcus sp.]